MLRILIAVEIFFNIWAFATSSLFSGVSESFLGVRKAIEKSVVGYNCSIYACKTCNGTVLASISNRGMFSLVNKSALHGGSDGVIINRLVEPRNFLFRIEDGICAALFGIPSDCIFLLNNVMRKEALQYRLKFNEKISGPALSSAVSDFFYEQSILQSSGVRPLAVYAVIATANSLHTVDCTGEIQSYGDLYASSAAFPLLASMETERDSDGGESARRGSNDEEVITLLARLKRDNPSLNTADVVHTLQSIVNRTYRLEIVALGVNNSTFFR